MKQAREKLHLRQIGRGFITCIESEGMIAGRRLTKTYVDQNNRTYIKVNGQFEPLTEQHSYLAVD